MHHNEQILRSENLIFDVLRSFIFASEGSKPKTKNPARRLFLDVDCLQLTSM